MGNATAVIALKYAFRRSLPRLTRAECSTAVLLTLECHQLFDCRNAPTGARETQIKVPEGSI